MSEYTYASDVTVRKNVSSIFPEYKRIDRKGGFRSKYYIDFNNSGLVNHPENLHGIHLIDIRPRSLPLNKIIKFKIELQGANETTKTGLTVPIYRNQKISLLSNGKYITDEIVIDMSEFDTINAGEYQNVFEVSAKNVLFLYYNTSSVTRVIIHSNTHFFNVTLPQSYFYCGNSKFFCPIRQRYKTSSIHVDDKIENNQLVIKTFASYKELFYTKPIKHPGTFMDIGGIGPGTFMDIGGIGHMGYEIKSSDDNQKSFGVLSFSIWERPHSYPEMLERPKYQIFKVNNIQQIIKYENDRFYMLPYSDIQKNGSITKTSDLDNPGLNLHWEDVTNSTTYKTTLISQRRNAFEINPKTKNLYLESFGHEGSGLRIRPFLLENNINTNSFCVLFKKIKGYDNIKNEEYTDIYAWIRNKDNSTGVYGEFVYGGAMRDYGHKRTIQSGSFLEHVFYGDGHVNRREGIVYNNLYFTHNDSYFLPYIKCRKKTKNNISNVISNVNDFHNSYKLIIGGEPETEYVANSYVLQLTSTEQEKFVAKQAININNNTLDYNGRKILNYKKGDDLSVSQSKFNIWNSVLNTCTGLPNTEYYTFVPDKQKAYICLSGIYNKNTKHYWKNNNKVIIEELDNSSSNIAVSLINDTNYTQSLELNNNIITFTNAENGIRELADDDGIAYSFIPDLVELNNLNNNGNTKYQITFETDNDSKNVYVDKVSDLKFSIINEKFETIDVSENFYKEDIDFNIDNVKYPGLFRFNHLGWKHINSNKITEFFFTPKTKLIFLKLKMSEINNFTQDVNRITLVNNNYKKKQAQVILRDPSNTNLIELSQDEQTIILKKSVYDVVNVELSIYNLKINGNYTLRVETNNDDDFKLEMSMVDRDREFINLINNLDIQINDVIIDSLNSLLNGDSIFELTDSNIITYQDDNTIVLSKDFLTTTISYVKNLIRNSNNNLDENFSFRKFTKKIIRKVLRNFDPSFTIKIHPDNMFISESFKNIVKDNVKIINSGNSINTDKEDGNYYSLLDNIGDIINFTGWKGYLALRITKISETKTLLQINRDNRGFGRGKEYEDGETYTLTFLGKTINILFGSVLVNIKEEVDEDLRDILIKKNLVNKNRSGSKVLERLNVGAQVKHLLTLDENVEVNKNQWSKNKKEKLQNKSADSRLLRLKGRR